MHLWSTVIYYPTADIYEQILLPQVIQSMAFRNFNLEDSLHRTQFLHYIQAGILLAQYFFRKGNLPEGKYHVAGAVSLVLDARLHQHAGFQSKARFNLNLQRDSFLEEQELINAFWGVLTLSNMWSTATAGPFLDFQSPAARVDIPWPSDLTIECPCKPGDRTILRFLTDTMDISDPDSILTVVAKAAILWLEATKFTLQYDPSEYLYQEGTWHLNYFLSSTQSARTTIIFKSLPDPRCSYATIHQENFSANFLWLSWKKSYTWPEPLPLGLDLAPQAFYDSKYSLV